MACTLLLSEIIYLHGQWFCKNLWFCRWLLNWRFCCWKFGCPLCSLVLDCCLQLWLYRVYFHFPTFILSSSFRLLFRILVAIPSIPKNEFRICNACGKKVIYLLWVLTFTRNALNNCNVCNLHASVYDAKQNQIKSTNRKFTIALNCERNGKLFWIFDLFKINFPPFLKLKNASVETLVYKTNSISSRCV